ncbi:hypothetical protein [Erwinia sp.]|uniref:hypothetical protein n=1 Tax=Erwinia citreus TaxID=558 RepID=UPI003C71511A
MRRLVSAAVQSGSVAIFPTSQDDFSALYALHAKAAIYNFSLEDGQKVELSHYCPASNRGAYTVRNLGIWSASDNRKFSDKHMPFGSQIAAKAFSDPHYKVSSTKDAREKIIKYFGHLITQITSDTGNHINLPLTQITKRVKKIMKTTNIEFNKLISMSKEDLITLLNKHGITKDEVKPAAFASTLSDVHRREIYNQINLYPGKAADLQELAQLCRDSASDEFDPYLLFGSKAITGRAGEALQELRDYITLEGIILNSNSFADPDAAIELDDGTKIYEEIEGRKVSELNSDQLYSWYKDSKHYNSKASITTARIKEFYQNELPVAA